MISWNTEKPSVQGLCPSLSIFEKGVKILLMNSRIDSMEHFLPKKNKTNNIGVVSHHHGW